MRAWLVCLAFLFVLVPSTARAASKLVTYRVSIAPTLDGSEAHFTLVLEYNVWDETKLSGFKYLGSSRPGGFLAHTVSGERLDGHVSLEVSSGQWRADFGLPQVPKGDNQVVVLEFDQSLDAQYGWSSRYVDVAWAPNFKIPVEVMTLEVLGPLTEQGNGLDCSGSGAERVCTKSGSTFSPSFWISGAGPGANSVTNIAIPLGTLAILVWIFLLRRNELLLLRGVLPPATDVSYIGAAQAGYRAPPPIEKASSVSAELSIEDAADLKQRISFAVAIVVIVGMCVGLSGPISYPKWAIADGSSLVVLVSIGIYFHREKESWWFLVVPLVAVSLFAFLGLMGLAVAAGIGGFALFISAASNAKSRGSSWSSGSSSCGSSSCGGGGGGGGCGGGGGGGGGGCGG